MAAIATRDSAAYKRYNEKLRAVKAEGKSSLQLAKPPRKRRRKSLRRSVILSILAAVGASAYILYCQMQLTQLTADTCRDAGETALAAKAELVGRVLLLAVAVPLFQDLLTLVTALMSGQEAGG